MLACRQLAEGKGSAIAPVSRRLEDPDASAPRGSRRLWGCAALSCRAAARVEGITFVAPCTDQVSPAAGAELVAQPADPNADRAQADAGVVVAADQIPQLSPGENLQGAVDEDLQQGVLCRR